eukprot:435787-Pelagomonas_calceolata.AAC.1
MTAAISVCPCPPVRDFEHKDWTRGQALALFESRHVGMHCIESRMVANIARLPVPGVPRGIQDGAELWIIVTKVGTCNGSEFITEMWKGSDGFGIE